MMGFSLGFYFGKNALGKILGFEKKPPKDIFDLNDIIIAGTVEETGLNSCDLSIIGQILWTENN